jgi:hypothetical protein
MRRSRVQKSWCEVQSHSNESVADVVDDGSTTSSGKNADNEEERWKCRKWRLVGGRVNFRRV